jgi:hypothetical protein
MVSYDSYYDFMDSAVYHTGHNRGPSGMHHDLARNNILAFFQSWGSTLRWSHSPGTRHRQ